MAGAVSHPLYTLATTVYAPLHSQTLLLSDPPVRLWQPTDWSMRPSTTVQ